jgi:hypothetical protein
MLIIDSPILDEVREILRKRYEVEFRSQALQDAVVATLRRDLDRSRSEGIAPLRGITDEGRLKELLRLAITCPDMDAFTAALVNGSE